MRSRRRPAPVPIGDAVISYEAKAMPTPVLERLYDENPSDLKVVRLLLRIALQKIHALEEAR
jgi:hypothetical protein